MIELSLLGTPELHRSGESSEAILVQPRRLALLAYLAASSGSLQRRDRLLLLFWGDQPESRARASLRQALYFIRRALGDDVLVSRGDDEVGLNHSNVSVDVVTLERAISSGDAEEALRIYRGDFLADFNIGDAPEFERWATERRRELRRSVAAAAWQLSDSALATGSRDAAIRFARRAVELNDYAENDVRRAMRAISAAGDRAAALAMYEILRERLEADLETVPEAETQQLARELRANGALAVSEAERTVQPVGDVMHEDPAQSVLRTTPERPRFTIGWLAAAVIISVSAIAGGTLLYKQSAGSADPHVASRVAVMPFTIRSASGKSAYLREGAATLLGLALDGAGRLRIVDPNAVLAESQAVVDLATGKRIATSLGAGLFVLGEIEEAGSRLNVAATLYDGAGRTQARATAVGDESRVFDLVDSLARRLAVSAMTDSTVRLATTAATSTQSLAAFKSFLAGETALRSGHYHDAVVALQDAIASDSAFGLAYYRLALAREWTDGEIPSDSAAALAEHFASRIPERDRKLLAARRAFIRRDRAEGERLTGEVLSSYPTDADAWAQLGEIRFHLGPNAGKSIDEAREPFVTVLRFRPNDLLARVHLTRIAARGDDTTHLNEWSGEDAWREGASEIGTFELASMRSVVLGDNLARDTVIASAKLANDLTIKSTIWRLGIYSGDPVGALKLARLANIDGADTRLDIGAVEIAAGHIAPLRSTSRRLLMQHALLVGTLLAVPSTPILPALARRVHGELMSAAGSQSDSVSASIVASMLEARYADSIPAHARAIALAPPVQRTVSVIVDAITSLRTNPSRALADVGPERLDETVIKSQTLYDVVASVRAEALHALGRNAEAIAWLNSIGMNSAGSGAVIAVAMRRIAEIEESAGSRAAAARDRARFVRMWSSCDPELRHLVDAARH